MERKHPQFWMGWLSLALGLLVLFSACASIADQSSLLNNKVDGVQQQRTYSGKQVSIQRHVSAPPTMSRSSIDTQPTPTSMPSTATGPSPYGAPPPVTDLEVQITQKLFATINQDRAAKGLYPFTWNATLSGGARLHSWNMYHCGFSHTCPDGLDQCVRIANEGFQGYSDCGENIGWAGPFPNAIQGAYNIHETMANEPPTGWHYIHLFSKTLNRVGVGVYVDPDGYVWFTEDMVS